MAYNCLVEKSMTGSFEKFDPKTSTLPAKTNRWREKITDEIDVITTVTPQQPPQKPIRPSTLPYRGASVNKSNMSSTKHSPVDNGDTNPLRKLRDKNFPFMRPRNAKPHNTVHHEFHSGAGCESAACISPDYPSCHEKDINFQTHDFLNQKMTECKEIDSLNPIPLPPRDKNKVILTNAKRHVRKHPLIIPGAELQRTLSKVTQDSPTDETVSVQKSLVSNNNYNVHPNKPFDETSKLKGIDIDNGGVGGGHDSDILYTKQFIENNFPLPSEKSRRKNINHPTYINLEENQNMMEGDTASLHFELILENDSHANQVMDVVDGANGFLDCFDIKKEQQFHKTTMNDSGGGGGDNIADISCSANNDDDELRNLDIERKKLEFSKKHPKYNQPANELASNSLFNKIKSTVDMMTIPSTSQGHSSDMSCGIEPRQRRKSVNDICDEDDEAFMEGNFISTANDVSCEDLLEFANEKPNGRERGVDSDEVRIMSKVLGKSVIPEQCLDALDAIDWDVHRAIKVYKLQSIMASANLTMNDCVDSLQKYDWDLQTTVLKLRKV